MATIPTNDLRFNVLLGSLGNDVLNATDAFGDEDGQLIGLAGDDIYIISREGHLVTEDPGAGTDTVLLHIGAGEGNFEYALPDNVENADASGSDEGVGFELTGNILNNILTGGDEDDLLDGGTGADTLAGGDGDDTYLVDNAGDRIVELAGGGDDEVHSFVTYTLPAEVERLTLMGAVAINGTGNAGANEITGNAGVNTLLGLDGDDHLFGGDGNDVLDGGNGSDLVFGEDGNDIVRGGEGADGVEGGPGNDLLQGGGGNDFLVGGPGVDRVEGGPGDDHYLLLAGLDEADVVVEARNGGEDAVQAQFSYTLPAEVENLYLLGDGLTGAGNAAANLLVGTGGNDVLFGLAGDDVLDGRDGDDWMEGGAGNDAYQVDTDGDSVAEAPNAGIDWIYSSLYALTLPANVEHMRLNEHGEDGTPFQATGNALDNSLVGNAGVNMLYGMAGNDWLDGGAGIDVMTGGTGNDTYVVDNIADRVRELNGEGTDTVRTGLDFYLLPTNVENLVLTGSQGQEGLGNALANSIAGGAGNDVLAGLAGRDVLAGGAGDDQYDLDMFDQTADTVVEAAGAGNDRILLESNYGLPTYVLPNNVEELWLAMGAWDLNGTGNALNNFIAGNEGVNILDGGAGNDIVLGGVGRDTLLGGAGNDTLSGGAGADRMDGGAGDDIYVVINGDGDGTAILTNEDVVVETPTGGRADLVISSAYAYTLPANVENLTLLGGSPPFDVVHIDAPWQFGTGNFARKGTGNNLNNVIVGNDRDNVLLGLGGNDTLDGRGGDDCMAGGAGNDTYVVGSAGDIVDETAGGSSGADTVRIEVTATFEDDPVFLSPTYHLPNGVEITTVVRPDGDPRLLLVFGTGGADRITGSEGPEHLLGDEGNDSLVGGAGDDILHGGPGADRMDGGPGNDLFNIDNRLDVIIEAATGGRDAVDLDADAYLASGGTTFVLAAPLEDLFMSGTANVNVTGNAGNNEVFGNEGSNTVVGLAGDDYLGGMGGDDRLDGGPGNDALDGGAGADLMIGGPGDDTYFVEDVNDVVTEAAGGGTDIAIFNLAAMGLTATLAANVENARVADTTPGDGDVVTGNALDNVITFDSFAHFSSSDGVDGAGGIDTANLALAAIDGAANVVNTEIVNVTSLGAEPDPDNNWNAGLDFTGIEEPRVTVSGLNGLSLTGLVGVGLMDNDSAGYDYEFIVSDWGRADTNWLPLTLGLAVTDGFTQIDVALEDAYIDLAGTGIEAYNFRSTGGVSNRVDVEHTEANLFAVEGDTETVLAGLHNGDGIELENFSGLLVAEGAEGEFGNGLGGTAGTLNIFLDNVVAELIADNEIGTLALDATGDGGGVELGMAGVGVQTFVTLTGALPATLLELRSNLNASSYQGDLIAFAQEGAGIRIFAGQGDDILVTGDSNHDFVFDRNLDGNDRIIDSAAGDGDTLSATFGTPGGGNVPVSLFIENVETLNLTIAGGPALIDLGGVRLEGMPISVVVTGDQHVEFTRFDPSPLAVDIDASALTGNLRGTGGGAPDTLIGGSGNDRLSGLGSADVLQGNDGADVFYFQNAPAGLGSIDVVLDFVSGTDRFLLNIDYFAEITFTGLGGAGPMDPAQFVSFESGTTLVPTLDADDRVVFDADIGELYYIPDAGQWSTAIPFFDVDLADTGTVAVTSADIFGTGP